MTAKMVKLFKFFGQKIFLESTGDKQIDSDLKQLFLDSYIFKKPCEMRRENSQRVLEWSGRNDIIL